MPENTYTNYANQLIDIGVLKALQGGEYFEAFYKLAAAISPIRGGGTPLVMSTFKSLTYQQAIGIIELVNFLFHLIHKIYSYCKPKAGDDPSGTFSFGGISPLMKGKKIKDAQGKETTEYTQEEMDSNAKRFSKMFWSGADTLFSLIAATLLLTGSFAGDSVISFSVVAYLFSSDITETRNKMLSYGLAAAGIAASFFQKRTVDPIAANKAITDATAATKAVAANAAANLKAATDTAANIARAIADNVGLSPAHAAAIAQQAIASSTANSPEAAAALTAALEKAGVSHAVIDAALEETAVVGDRAAVVAATGANAAITVLQDQVTNLQAAIQRVGSPASRQIAAAFDEAKPTLAPLIAGAPAVRTEMGLPTSLIGLATTDLSSPLPNPAAVPTPAVGPGSGTNAGVGVVIPVPRRNSNRVFPAPTVAPATAQRPRQDSAGTDESDDVLTGTVNAVGDAVNNVVDGAASLIGSFFGGNDTPPRTPRATTVPIHRDEEALGVPPGTSHARTPRQGK